MRETTVATNHGNAQLNSEETTRDQMRVPRVDILESEHDLVLYAELPGVAEDQVDLRFEKGELTLHGRRSGAARTASPFVLENPPGDYYRSFQVSEQINGEKIWAEMKGGVLTVHLPKVESVKPRKIPIKPS